MGLSSPWNVIIVGEFLAGIYIPHVTSGAVSLNLPSFELISVVHRSWYVGFPTSFRVSC